MRLLVIASAILGLNLIQTDLATAATAEDSWKALSFLEGTWDAHTQSGSAGAQGNGTYTFKHELNRHVLARYSQLADCKGPKAYDCKHSDLLYVYQEGQGQPLKAIYFDSQHSSIRFKVGRTVSNPSHEMFSPDPLDDQQYLTGLHL